MFRFTLPFATAALLATTAPALAQTDDRILNDILALEGAAMVIEQTALLCLTADMDISADIFTWTERNTALLDSAAATAEMRGGIEPAIHDSAMDEARGIAARSFVAESDREEYCDRIGDVIDSGGLDLAVSHPAQAARVPEAEAGKWPPLDLTNARPVADAIALKQHAFAMTDILARCGTLFPPAGQYDDARAEWDARNSYSLELADRVLANWGALHPSRWEAARDASGSAVDAMVADEAGFTAHCNALVPRIMSGAEDLDQTQPEITESVHTNAEIMP